MKLLLKYTRIFYISAAEHLIILTSDEQYRLSLIIKLDAMANSKSNCNFRVVYDRLRLTCTNIILYKIIINIMCIVKLNFEQCRIESHQ